MTAAFDHMTLRDLVGLLSEDEQRDLRPVVLPLVASHGEPIPEHDVAGETARHLSFAGTVEAEPDFASSSQEVLWRDLGGRS
ncbi:hypothetical protein IU448_23525 [Nocardia flavorosea]|uniref:hypothetical protein n=1 Tax=Nocardia flavorosea TaxID=53429 RepID=UPI00189415B6|nr:hypothetical protein [Nocardia flavorosea]MBF6351963.1 hypothetical protein [Nocardia flavorosea]